MKVKDILKLALEFVGEKELLEKVNKSDENQGVEEIVFSERERQKLDEMLLCFNMVNQEIASDYLPFLTKETLAATRGMFLFSELSKKVVNIYEVKDKFGFNLNFKVISNCVETRKSAKTVVYSFLPESLEIEDEVEFCNGLSARVYAYGVASEFLLVSGLSSDAEIWEERYKESLFILSRKRGEHRLPKRSWR